MDAFARKGRGSVVRTLCPSNVPIQSPVTPFRSIGCLSRQALRRKTPSTVCGENCSSTMARLWPGHTMGICRTKSTPAFGPVDAWTTYAFSGATRAGGMSTGEHDGRAALGPCHPSSLTGEFASRADTRRVLGGAAANVHTCGAHGTGCVSPSPSLPPSLSPSLPLSL